MTTKSSQTKVNKVSKEGIVEIIESIVDTLTLKYIYVLGQKAIDDYPFYEHLGVFDTLEEVRRIGKEYYENDGGGYWDITITKMKINKKYQSDDETEDQHPDLFENEKAEKASNRKRKANEKRWT